MSSQTKKRFEYIDVWAYASSRMEIIVNIKNIGTLEAAITSIFIEDRPLSIVNGGTSNPRIPITLKVGASETITLTFRSPLASGITNITIRTYSSREYSKVVIVS